MRKYVIMAQAFCAVGFAVCITICFVHSGDPKILWWYILPLILVPLSRKDD